ncbi:hypothetical protein FA13DRAFT_1739958 [Coprinellus micaceus]|uniref:Uncharacterized protein n=1 Tax=Coprinellus micaceus TaxID=71717 RepID=A0A4Y7SNR0_COPMI|nr:hypothetical protein FA13DRAFT_1739958 [Coprinellus micaceus]
MNSAIDVNAMDRRSQGESSTYVNSLAAATIPPTASPTISRKTVNSAEQERDRQAEEFNKSVTIIFWYKAKTEPLRIQQTIATFPYFQLARLGSLISDLGLSSNSYLDTYIPSSGQWEQHTITSVRVVDSQQRLLYRVRKSIFEGLSEDDCVGLKDEVRLQRASAGYSSHPPQVLETVSPHSLKRYAAEPLESTQPNKIHVPNSYYIDDKAPQALAVSNAPVSLPTPPSTAQVLPGSSQDESTYIYRPQQQQQQQPQQQQPQQQQQAPQQNYYASPAATPGTAVPSPYATSDKDHGQHNVPVHYPPHPPLKRWPNDYTVYELTAGFNAMDQLIAQSPAGDNMTQRVAFERIFGLRYVKSTVCRHRAIWKKADAALRSQFEGFGTDQRACWGEFVRRVEGRPSSKSTGATVPGGTTSNIANGGADEHQQHQGEPVMDSLQIPGGPGQGSNVVVGSSLQGSGAMPGQIYDSSLAQHMSASSHG